MLIRNIGRAGVAARLALAVITCLSVAPVVFSGGAVGGSETSASVSFAEHSADGEALPPLSVAILESDVGSAYDWDKAHRQFLAELVRTGIFESVAIDPHQLVDYGASFQLSRLSGSEMQVQISFMNMHTGETVFTGVTTGNRRNGNFGLAYIDGTPTSAEDALKLQSAIVRALRDYRVNRISLAGRSIAVLEPYVDDSLVPPDEPDVVEAFGELIDGRYPGIVKSQLVAVTDAEIVGGPETEQGSGTSGLAGKGLIDVALVAAAGQAMGVDYAMASRIAYDPDGYFVIELQLVDTAAESIYRSAQFEASVWDIELMPFEIGTRIDQMVHERARPGETGVAAVASADATTASELAPPELTIAPVFPVFYSYYDDHPVGTARLTNVSNRELSDLAVSFYVDQYMENPKSSDTIAELGPGESVDVALFALFTSEIMQITEDSKISARIVVEYASGGAHRTLETARTVEVRNRNALTWDDDRKFAAFITARDPAVMSFARNVTAMVQERTAPGINSNLAIAMGMHEALNDFGVRYIPDPITAYAEYSTSSTAVDYLLFPRQTLEYRGGDCDDLSALYCALLEAVGIETAFITIPGHIYAAVSLGADPSVARSAVANPDELVIVDGRAWLPVEVTERFAGFTDAWQIGAKEWREYDQQGKAVLYRTHAAWETYEPVGLPGSASLEPVNRAAIADDFTVALGAFVDREIASALPALLDRRKSDPDNPKWANRIGILYGRYGKVDEARSEFERALSVDPEYTPALINLGNLDYLAGDISAALAYYEWAQSNDPDDPQVLLAVARANHALENYGSVRVAYDKLQQVAPEVALRFDYLALRGEEATRAARAGGVEDTVLWSDGE